VYATYKSGTVPVYRYYNNFDHDHVYTTNYHKWGKGGSYRTPDGEHGYTYEGVAFYIYKYPRAGLKPIYAFVNPKNGNKIFSMSNTQVFLIKMEWGDSEALLSSLARTVHLCALAHVSVHMSSFFVFPCAHVALVLFEHARVHACRRTGEPHAVAREFV
jgi:hypothetical protein